MVRVHTKQSVDNVDVCVMSTRLDLGVDLKRFSNGHPRSSRGEEGKGEVIRKRAHPEHEGEGEHGFLWLRAPSPSFYQGIAEESGGGAELEEIMGREQTGKSERGGTVGELDHEVDEVTENEGAADITSENKPGKERLELL